MITRTTINFCFNIFNYYLLQTIDKMKWLLLLVCCVVVTEATSLIKIAMDDWTLFKLDHGKSYEDATEDHFRQTIFNENKHMIARHNQRFAEGQVSYSLGMNQYGDMLHSEYTHQFSDYKPTHNTEKSEGSAYVSPANVVIPDSVDWTKEGYVTPVRNSGKCGSCWAICVVESLEGQHFKKTGKLVPLSVQQLVDCSRMFGNEGCNGGFMDNGFQYIKVTEGVEPEKSYPYTAKDGNCTYDSTKIEASSSGYVDLPKGDEKKLQEAVATIGPIAGAVDNLLPEFKFYKSGIFDDPRCHNYEVHQGVLVVGYGTENGTDFWLAKNSRGTGWGEKGYIRMVRNKNDQCGIAYMASYPLV